MAADSKEVLHQAVHGQKPLRVGGRLEPPHLVLALARRLVGDFGAIVRVLVRAVHHGRHRAAMGRRVAAELVRDQTARCVALSL